MELVSSHGSREVSLDVLDEVAKSAWRSESETEFLSFMLVGLISGFAMVALHVADGPELSEEDRSLSMASSLTCLACVL